MTTLRAYDGETLLWTIDPAEVAPHPFTSLPLLLVSGVQVMAPPPSKPVFYPAWAGRVIIADDMGADVQSWQDRLSHLGYTIPTSGTFDSASVQETKIFQSAQGLSPSGLVDEATWKAAFHPFAGV